MPRPRVDPNLRAELEAAERIALLQLRAVRAQGRRDVMASLMQASATNPLWTQAFIGVAGAGLAMAGGFLDRARHEIAAEAPAGSWGSRLLQTAPGRTLGQSPLETLGEGMMAMAGARATVDGLAAILGAVRGTSQSSSLAFDLGSPGAAASIAGGGGLSFRARSFAERG